MNWKDGERSSEGMLREGKCIAVARNEQSLNTTQTEQVLPKQNC